MKKLLFSCIALLVTQIISATDWLPFNEHQTNFYSSIENNIHYVDNFTVDSVYEENGSTFYFFDTKKTNSNSCHESIMTGSMDYAYIELAKSNPIKIQSINLIEKSVIYNRPKSMWFDKGTFLFKPFAQVGESWQTNSVKIECKSISEIEILGIKDSIKTFKCTGGIFDGEELILTKYNGFFKFISFHSFIDQSKIKELQLIGIENKDYKTGFAEPSFSAYFNINIGDAFLWKYNKGGMQGVESSSAIYIDSIIGKSVTEDSIVFTFNRRLIEEELVSWDSHYSKFDDKTFIITYKTDYYSTIFKNGTSVYGKHNINSDNLFYKDSYEYSSNGEKSIIRNKYRPHVDYVNNTCNVRAMGGPYSEYTFEINKGLIKYKIRESDRWQEYNLIGSYVNGVMEGEIKEYTSTKLPVNKPPTQLLSQNPVTDFLRVNINSTEIESIEIFDINGKHIFVNSGSNEINTNNLTSGIYILQVKTTSGVIHNSKFVKIK